MYTNYLLNPIYQCGWSQSDNNFIVIGSKQVRQLQYSQSKYQAALPHHTKKDLNRKLNPKQNTIRTLRFILKSLE